LIYTTGNIVGSLAVLLLLAILARLLSPSDFGLYAIAIAFYYILTSHYIFGVVLRKELPNSRSRERASELMSSCYFVALAIAFAVAVVAMLFSSSIAVSVYHNASLTLPLQLAAALVFFYVLFNVLLATLIAIGKVAEGTIMYLVYSFVQLFASTALVLMGYGIFGAIAGLGISLVVPSLLGMYWASSYIKGRFVRPTKAVIKRIMNFSAPVLASSIATQAPPNLAILFLAAYTSSAIVGNYNAAYRFGNFINVLLLAMSYVLLPAFSRAFSSKSLASRISYIYNRSIYYTLLLLLPISVYAVSVSQPLIYLLFSSAYTFAPLYFALIVMGSAIGMVNTYASNLQVSYGNTKIFMYYQLLSVAIQIALLAALTPALGAIGVILALFIISQIVLDVIYVHALYRQFSLEHDSGQVGELVVSSVILLAVLYSVTMLLHGSGWALVANLVITVLLFPALAAFLGGIKRNNLEFLSDIAKSLRMSAIARYPIRFTELFIRR
jgi:O-antigen/teichoic acid export membrane protein